MKSLKYSFLLILGLMLNLNAKSQIITGGNVSFNVDNYGAMLDFAPMIGYRIKTFETGVTPFFSYTMPKDGTHEYMYGGRIFAKQTIAYGIFAHAEFEGINIADPGNDDKRKWTMGLPLGIGYEHVMGKVRMHASILYDVLLDDDVNRKNPIYRAGIIYDF